MGGHFARRAGLVALFAALLGMAPAASAAPGPPNEVAAECLAPAGNPAPGTPEWQQRDTDNQYCATLRNRDQLASPAFGYANTTQGAALSADQAAQQLDEPGHVHGGITTLLPTTSASIPTSFSAACRSGRIIE